MSHPFSAIRDPQVIQQLMPAWEWLYRYYFRVQTSGWEHIPSQGQLLFVGSHNGGLSCPDLPMFLYDWFKRFGYDRPVYGLTHAKIWQAYPGVVDLAEKVGSIPFYSRNAMAVLKAGDSLLVYPGGGEDTFRPHRLRDRIQFKDRRGKNRTGFIRLALWYNVPIIPTVSWGAHDTLIVLEDCYDQAKRLHDLGIPWPLGIDPEVVPVYLGWPWGLAIGPLPNIPFPAQIHTRVCPPIYFERTGYEASRDKSYVQACYHQVVNAMQGELDRLAQQLG